MTSMDGMNMMQYQHAPSHAQQPMQQFSYPSIGAHPDPSQQGASATGGGWGSPQQTGAGSPFATLAEQPLHSVEAYGQAGQRQDPSQGGGGFGASPLPAYLTAGHGVGGGFGNSLGLLERSMSGTTLSDGSGDSPPQGSWEKLYVSNLPRQFTEVDVQRLFAPYGTPTEVALHKRGDGQSKGCFFVSFATPIEGQQAVRALHNYLLPGTQRPMSVRPSTSRRREARTANNPPGPAGAAALPLN